MRRAAIILTSGLLALGVTLLGFTLAALVLRAATNMRPHTHYRVTWLEKQ